MRRLRRLQLFCRLGAGGDTKAMPQPAFLPSLDVGNGVAYFHLSRSRWMPKTFHRGKNHMGCGRLKATSSAVSNRSNVRPSADRSFCNKPSATGRL